MELRVCTAVEDERRERGVRGVIGKTEEREGCELAESCIDGRRETAGDRPPITAGVGGPT